MAGNKKPTGPFTAKFIYTDDILSDFAAVYNAKKQVRPLTRLICALIGIAGALYFGWALYTDGNSVARVGYLVGCSLLLLVAVSGGRGRGDGTIDKYKRHYAGRKVDFRRDEDGVWMQLEKQKNQAHSKFDQIYGLYDSDKCFYFVIKGKAYYIVSKKAVSGGTAEELAAYMRSHCKKNFLHYDVSDVR